MVEGSIEVEAPSDELRVAAAMLERWWLILIYIYIYISMDYDKIRQIIDYCEDANTWSYDYHQVGIITGYTSIIHIVRGN